MIRVNDGKMEIGAFEFLTTIFICASTGFNALLWLRSCCKFKDGFCVFQENVFERRCIISGSQSVRYFLDNTWIGAWLYLFVVLVKPSPSCAQILSAFFAVIHAGNERNLYVCD
jgi:hypothetical protein